MNYRPEIDGLRALAVLPVVLFHAEFPLFAGGFVGVDIFFVISGYLITAILLEGIDNNAFSLKLFYERRARRILPAMFTVLSVSGAISIFVLPPTDLVQFGKSLVATVTFCANFLFWSQSGYFDTQSDFKPLLHMWSLSVEEQFYLVFPILLMLSVKFNIRKPIVLLGGITLVSLLLSVIAINHRPSAAFFLLPFRAWELLVGALLAVFIRHNPETFFISERWQSRLAFLGLFLLFLSLIIFDKHSKFPGASALIPVTGAGLVILFAAPGNMVGQMLSNSSLVGLGLISYSLYLWHNPILTFLRFCSIGPLSIELTLFSIVLSIFCAYLTWRYIENPCRNSIKVSSRQLFIFLFSVGIFLCGFGLYLVKEVGLPQRLGANQSLLISATSSPLRNSCHNSETHKVRVQSSCEYFGKQIEVATFGDSHVVELSYVLAERLKPYNIGLKHFSYTACPPSFGRAFNKDECISWTKQAVDYIVNSQVSTVVVSYRIHGALFGYHEGLYPQLPDLYSDAYREEIWGAYIEVLNAFIKSGKKVILVLQAPELKSNISQLVFLNGQNPGDIVGMTREWLDRRESYVRARLPQIPKEVIVIDPRPLFCDDLSCYASRGGNALYFDEDHLSIFGASLMADQIIPFLELSERKQIK